MAKVLLSRELPDIEVSLVLIDIEVDNIPHNTGVYKQTIKRTDVHNIVTDMVQALGSNLFLFVR